MFGSGAACLDVRGAGLRLAPAELCARRDVAAAMSLLDSLPAPRKTPAKSRWEDDDDDDQPSALAMAPAPAPELSVMDKVCAC